MKRGGMIKIGRYARLQETAQIRCYNVIPIFRGRWVCMVRAKGGDASKRSCCLLLTCFLSLLETPPCLDAFGFSLHQGSPWGPGLGGWLWMSQHLVAFLKHCQSLVQDLPFAEILTVTIKAVVGSVCVRAMKLFQLSLCLLTGCVMKVLSFGIQNMPDFGRSNTRETWLTSREGDRKQHC